MKHMGLSLAVALTVLMPSAVAGAQSAPPPRASLLILAKQDHTLAIVNPATLKVEARIPVGDNPHEVIASADGRRAYVSNYGNGSLDTITVVDLVARRPLTKIELGPLWGPHGLSFVGGSLWFTAEREKLIGRIDPTMNKVAWLLGTGQVGTHMLWVSQDTRHIVTVSVGSGAITLIDQRPVVPAAELAQQPPSKAGGQTTRGTNGPPAPDWDETVIKVGGRPEGFDVLHDAAGNPTTIWVANAVEGTVSIIDVASRKVVGTIAANVPTANRLHFTPDGKLVLVSSEKGKDLVVIDVPTRTVVKRIPIGTGGAGTVIQPDGARAFVSCSPDNYVAVIDLKTMSVVGRIDAGKEPDGEAWAVRH